MAAPEHFAWLALTTIRAADGTDQVIEFSCTVTDTAMRRLGQVSYTIRDMAKHPTVLKLEVPQQLRSALEANNLWADMVSEGVPLETAETLCRELLDQFPGTLQAMGGPTHWHDRAMVAERMPLVAERLRPEWIDAHSVRAGIAVYVPSLPVTEYHPYQRTYQRVHAFINAYVETLNVLKGAS